MPSRLKIEIQKLRTAFRKLTGGSDAKRWAPIHSLHPSWDNRTKILASYIPTNSNIIEFGAGRLVLKKYLPQNCNYTPSDLTDRGPGTIVLDLNAKQLPEFEHYDYAVFSGVLEYVNNVPKLIKHLSNYVEAFAFSYASKDKFPKDRGYHGWVNQFSEAELIAILNGNNYQLEKRGEWKNQTLFVFQKKKQK